MTLTQFEQSGFIIQTDSGFRLAIDIGNKTPVERLAGITVDAMIISHIHGDHFSLDQIRAINPPMLYLNQECVDVLDDEVLEDRVEEVAHDTTITIGDISVHIFNVDHGPNISAPLAENFGFLITADGSKIYFAGDMFYESGIDVSKLAVNFLLLPVGTHYTFGPAEALAFARKFAHIDTIVPMHYAKKPETLDEFISIAEGYTVKTL